MFWRKKKYHSLELAQSGHRFRPRKGKCPICKTKENEWCRFSCPLIDPLDYR